MISINENIEKKIDLINNQGLSVFSGLAAQQNHNAFEIFFAFLQNYSPDRILEIGTGQGGFINFIMKCIKSLHLNTYILSYDINYLNWYEELLKEGIDVRIKNIFAENCIINEIAPFVQDIGKCLVLCDGGSKKDEFNIISQYLKSNDIIMAHDYAPNPEYFEQYMRNKIWNWHEIQDSDIMNSCAKYGLKPYMKEQFLQVAWACFKKE
jgi:hypothetical protein